MRGFGKSVIVDFDLQGLKGVVYGCKKSKPMFFLTAFKGYAALQSSM